MAGNQLFRSNQTGKFFIYSLDVHRNFLGQQNAELISSDPVTESVFPVTVLECTSDMSKAGVSGLMSAGIVDLFEPIDVEHKNGRLFVQCGTLDVITLSVKQPGQ